MSSNAVPIPEHQISSESVEGPEKLTLREQQVLVLIAEGYSTKEIGNRLGITFKTAASHRSRIMSKLGVHNSVALVRYAIRLGLIQP